MDRWKNKCAVVTGAGSGIGRAIATALVKKNVNVLALDVKTKELMSLTNELKLEKGGSLCVMPCDVADEKQLDKAFLYTQSTWTHGVDIMVNNAGVVDYTRVIGKT